MKQMISWYSRVHVSKVWESFASPFTLENGMEQLRPYFSQVTLSRYDDDLIVTELPPLMDYIRSGMRVAELSNSELATLQFDLERELKEKGSIFITKDSGLFEAIK